VTQFIMEIEQHPRPGQIDVGGCREIAATSLTSDDFRNAARTVSRIVSALM